VGTKSAHIIECSAEIHGAVYIAMLNITDPNALETKTGINALYLYKRVFLQL